MDTFLKKKWERVFYIFFDIDRNNIIDWNDFELLFEKIKDLRGEQSSEYKIVRDTMRMVWRGLMHVSKGINMYATSDIDLKLKLSLDEWNKMWQKYKPNRMDIWQWEYVKYMFFLIDTSGDKHIDKDEYVNVMSIYGLTKDEAEKAFDKFAVDKQGNPISKVDYGRFVELWTEYFVSRDKNDPGSYLFGCSNEL